LVYVGQQNFVENIIVTEYNATTAAAINANFITGGNGGVAE
jgi:hypothetical protein